MKVKLLLPLVALLFSSFTFSQNINQPNDLIVCNDFNNGETALFNLEAQTFQILGNLSPNDYQLTYHESLLDAESFVNALISPYTNVTNPQTIYARVEELSTGNFEITSFDLIVNALPIPNLSNVYEICDGADLIVETGLTAQGLIFSWYLDGIYLQNETFPFLSVTQTGFYQLEISTIDGCSSFYDFQVTSGTFENLVTPSAQVVCDDDGDGFSSFNLWDALNEIGLALGIPTQMTIHETLVDAETGVNAINPIYNNIVPYTQTLYVNVSTVNTDCYGITTIDLIVETDCVPATSLEVFVCGDDPNTPVDYDLTSQEANMLNGQNPSDFTFEYYLTQVDADNQSNPLVDPTAYTVSGNSSVVFVRIEDNSSANFTIVQLFVNFNLKPQVDFIGPYTICNGGEVVLTPFLNNSNNFAYSYVWSTGEFDQEITVNTPGTYTITVTDLSSGCESTASVDVIEGGDAPVLVDATDIFSCVPNSFFDLTATLPEILNGQDESQFIINFFDNANSAFSNTNEIFDPTNFIALEAVETIFVRVQNSDDSCFSIVNFNIITENSCVIPLDCSEGTVNVSFCYESSQVTEYYYQSTDDSPLQVFFNAGQVEVNYDELVVLDSDGVTNLNPTQTTYGNNGDLTGLSFMSSGNSIRIAINADDSISCVNQNYIPIDFDVSCVDPNAVPDCNAILLQPVNGSSNVEQFTNLVWTATSGIVNGYKLSVGITSGGTEVLNNVDVGNVTNYDLGILDFEVTYYVSITPYNDNGDAENCEEYSFTTQANPNQMVVCEDGAVNTTYCYGNDDTTEFSFESSDGLPLTLIFNAGGTEQNYDVIYVVDSDGSVLNPDLPYGNNGDFAGLIYTSTGSSITVRFDTDGTISCANGSGCCNEPFDFDVFCASTIGTIEVNAFVDANTNSTYDANEFSFSNGYFTYEVNGDGMINTVNSSTGHFSIISDNETDVYDITFNLYEESGACYDVTTASFNTISVATGSTVTVDFPVVEEQSCEDLAVYLLNYWTPPRPGFSHENYIILENLGFTTIASGTVEFTHDPLLVFNGVTNVNSNYTITNTATGFTVDFVNLQPGDVEYIDISLTCPVTVELGDIVTNTATYVTDTNDLVASNNSSNLSEVVVGSYDPNDKMESHGPKVVYDDFVVSDQWLYYTIRFQNLGTFPATFVRIEDELNVQLDETTFQMLRSSHDFVVTRTESSLEWFFEDINLPAEQDDAEGSIGFVYFRIKPKAGYVLGDVIPNTAAIFFDFNAPVITNRFETEFVEETLSVAQFDNNGFEMYPNPAKDILNIRFNHITNASLTIYDIQGKLVLKQQVSQTQNFNLNVSALNSGFYFVKMNLSEKEIVKKLIID